jgi:hypothetical protein
MNQEQIRMEQDRRAMADKSSKTFNFKYLSKDKQSIGNLIPKKAVEQTDNADKDID